MTEELLTTDDTLPFDDELYRQHKKLVDTGIENLHVWELNGYHESVRWIEAYHKALSKIKVKEPKRE